VSVVAPKAQQEEATALDANLAELRATVAAQERENKKAGMAAKDRGNDIAALVTALQQLNGRIEQAWHEVICLQEERRNAEAHADAQAAVLARESQAAAGAERHLRGLQRELEVAALQQRRSRSAQRAASAQRKKTLGVERARTVALRRVQATTTRVELASANVERMLREVQPAAP